MQTNLKGVSVVICCFNSVSRLPDTLEYLSKQMVEEALNWEIVIVDNNSSDETASIAIQEWSRYNLTIPLRIVEELTPGLTHARKKGVLESHYDFIIFCDDDNWLDPNYIEKVYQNMSTNSSIGIIGGNGTPVYEIEPDDWFLQGGYVKGLAIGPQDASDKIVDITKRKKYVHGAGLAIRKNLALKLFNDDFLLSDRKGKSLLSGGDEELCYKAILSGFQIWYDPSLLFHHYIPTSRTTFAYIQTLSRWKAYSSILLLPYKIIINNNYLLQSKNIWVKKLFYQIISLFKTSFSLLLENSESSHKRIAIQIIIGKIHALLKYNYKIDIQLKQLKEKYKYMQS